MGLRAGLTRLQVLDRTKCWAKQPLVPEEGEEKGSVWSGFSMGEMLPMDGCGSWKQVTRVLGVRGGTDVVCLEWRSSRKTNREVLEPGIHWQPQSCGSFATGPQTKCWPQHPHLQRLTRWLQGPLVIIIFVIM